jgi:hypothetical protein
MFCCRRSNTWSGATAQLMLTHLLTLALHHIFVVLQHKCLIHHSLEVLKVMGLQSIGQSIIQTIQKAILLLLIGVHFIGSIARQLSELDDTLILRHGLLFQILNRLLLQLHHSLGYMVCTERSSKLWLVDALRFLMGIHVCIPPVGCRTRKLMRG